MISSSVRWVEIVLDLNKLGEALGVPSKRLEEYV